VEVEEVYNEAGDSPRGKSKRSMGGSIGFHKWGGYNGGVVTKHVITNHPGKAMISGKRSLTMISGG